jgi:hypothetical protein
MPFRGCCKVGGYVGKMVDENDRDLSFSSIIGVNVAMFMYKFD